MASPTIKGLLRNLLITSWQEAIEIGELRFGKTVHFDEARVFKLFDGKEEFVKTVTKFKSLPMA